MPKEMIWGPDILTERGTLGAYLGMPSVARGRCTESYSQGAARGTMWPLAAVDVATCYSIDYISQWI